MSVYRRTVTAQSIHVSSCIISSRLFLAKAKATINLQLGSRAPMLVKRPSEIIHQIELKQDLISYEDKIERVSKTCITVVDYVHVGLNIRQVNRFSNPFNQPDALEGTGFDHIHLCCYNSFIVYVFMLYKLYSHQSRASSHMHTLHACVRTFNTELSKSHTPGCN